MDVFERDHDHRAGPLGAIVINGHQRHPAHDRPPPRLLAQPAAFLSARNDVLVNLSIIAMAAMAATTLWSVPAGRT